MALTPLSWPNRVKWGLETIPVDPDPDPTAFDPGPTDPIPHTLMDLQQTPHPKP